MKKIRNAATLLSLVVALIGASHVHSAQAANTNCDRACLEGWVNRYLDALVAHDPSKIPFTQNVRFVENGVQLPLGSALWKTARARGSYAHYFADTTAGQAGFIGTLREHDNGLILVLRLAVQQGKIAEIEQLAIRQNNVDEYEKLKIDPLWLTPVSESQRLSRDKLAALANHYYTGMQGNDPKGDYSFFHKDCNRVEHGRQTTNNQPSNYGHSDIPDFVTWGCEKQFQTGFLGFVTLIRDRRYPVIDEERQAVLAFAAFDHNGSIRKIPLSTGQVFNVPPYFSTPRTLSIAEGFKIIDNKLRLIEAALTESAYGMANVFDKPPAVPTPSSGDSCDQQCAHKTIDTLLAAMIAHDASKAPLDKNVRYTENGQPLAIGDGLWRTLTARGSNNQDGNLYLVGENDVGLYGNTMELDIPGQIALRVRQKQGRITEIEALIVRQEIPMFGKLIGTGTLFAPPQIANFDATQFTKTNTTLAATVPVNQRSSAVTLGQLAKQYVQALHGSDKSPNFTDHCSVRINGVQATNNNEIATLNTARTFHPYKLVNCQQQVDSNFYQQIDQLDQARVLVTDVEQGLVIVATAVNHSGDIESIKVKPVGQITVPEPFRIPSAYYQASVLKVRAGRIEHVETIERPVFYGMTLGWDK